MINNNYTNHNKYNLAFKGLDASRPLKAVYCLAPKDKFSEFVSYFKELEKIGKQEKFKVVCLTKNGFFNNAEAIDLKNHTTPYSWLQDMAMLLPEKRLLFQDFDTSLDNVASSFVRKLANQLNLSILNPRNKFGDKFLKGKICDLSKSLEGGNIYQIKNKMGYQCVLMGKDCEGKMNMSEFYDTFKTNDIDFVPQADFHIDMFLRPLSDGKILVADDKLTIKWLKNIQNVLENYPNVTEKQRQSFKKFVENFEKSVAKNNKRKKYCSTDDVIKYFESKNFPTCPKYEIIRVPGRIYKTGKDFDGGFALFHDTNYMNAVVQKREDGTFAYITNKSNPQNTGGISLDKIFARFLKRVCPQITDVHFIGGKNNYGADELFAKHGGLHCRVTEIN